MKYLLLFVAIGLSLAGCCEKKPGEVEVAPPLSLTPPSFIKATTECPFTILAALDPTAACSIDWVDDKTAQEATPIKEKAKVKLAGWAGNVEAGTSPQEVFVELDGPSKVYFKASPGLNRPDVAAHFKKPGLASSGWEVYADLSGVTAGTYKAQVIQVKGQSGLTCDTKRSIVVS
ncbi:MAG: hypothetical protein WC530_03370 [Candidatus Omnitrophota bacterium]|jgi:hypothetical protein